MTDTTQALTTVEHRALDQAALPEAVEAALMQGDIAKLSAEHRVMYYRSVCHSLGLNYLTRPFDLIKDDSGKYQLYARKEATEQLRKLHRVSTRVVGRERLDELYIVTVQASTPQGRVEESQGIVYIGQAKGQALANALMKAETKAKRRATLAICGLGWMLVEEETRGQQMAFDPQTGVLDDEPRPALVAPADEDAPLADEDAAQMDDQPQQDSDPSSAPAGDSRPSQDAKTWHQVAEQMGQVLREAGFDHGRTTAWLKETYEVAGTRDLTVAHMQQVMAHVQDPPTEGGMPEPVRAYLRGETESKPLAPFQPEATPEQDEGRLV